MVGDVFSIPLRLIPKEKRILHVYNAVRPQQALRYLTPLEFLEPWKSHNKADCH